MSRNGFLHILNEIIYYHCSTIGFRIHHCSPYSVTQDDSTQSDGSTDDHKQEEEVSGASLTDQHGGIMSNPEVNDDPERWKQVDLQETDVETGDENVTTHRCRVRRREMKMEQKSDGEEFKERMTGSLKIVQLPQDGTCYILGRQEQTEKIRVKYPSM